MTLRARFEVARREDRLYGFKRVLRILGTQYVIPGKAAMRLWRETGDNAVIVLYKQALNADGRKLRRLKRRAAKLFGSSAWLPRSPRARGGTRRYALDDAYVFMGLPTLPHEPSDTIH